jgi:ABC-type multidrug transport system fused ATPase/permease subunit
MLQLFANVIATVGIVCYLVPLLTPVIIVGGTMLWWQIKIVDVMNREAKRMANNAMSPILTNASEIVNGRLLIQLMSYEQYFERRHLQAADGFNRFTYMATAILIWGQLQSTLIAFLAAAFATSLIVANRDDYEDQEIGLALAYSFLISYFLLHLSVCTSMTKMGLTSLERLNEYQNDLPVEPAWDVEGDETLLNDAWPQSGKIDFRNAVLQYRPNLPPALKNVSFTIDGGQSVGVIGRSGVSLCVLSCLLFFCLYYFFVSSKMN